MKNNEISMDVLITIINEINQLTFANIKFKFFEDTHIIPKPKDSNELNFLFSIVFFYGLFVELSRVNLDFIIEKMKSMTNGNYKHLSIVKNNVVALRTNYFHNLDPSKERTKETLKSCSMWYLKSCGKYSPEDDSDWSQCFETLKSDSLSALNSIKQCINIILDDEDKDYIIDDWATRKSKDLQDYQLEEIVSQVFQLLNLKQDSYKFTKTNSNKIKSHISGLSALPLEGLILESRLFIEHLVFEADMLICPLSAKEIQEIFNVTGKDLGDIKQKAIKIFNQDVYQTKDEIIAKLQVRN